MEKFWMLFVLNGNSPTYQHESKESAYAEARRLARVSGQKVYVLEADAAVEFLEYKWTVPGINTSQEDKNNELPF